MELTEFLLARIAEDEALGSDTWRRPHWGYCNTQGDQSSLGDECDCGLPARVLAECEAKRRIVERYTHLYEHGDSGDMRWTLPLLALPYADHPDYNPEWKPL
jgi:hypothetical protein